MTLPIVEVNELTILLGNTIVGTDLLSFFDDDGDEVTQVRVRDNNADPTSSFLVSNGVTIPPNVWVELDVSELDTLFLNSGTSIQTNNYEFQAFSNGEWGPINSQNIYSVVENVTRPIVQTTNLSVVQSESILIRDFVSAVDPDGFPIRRYRIFDSSPGELSGRIVVDGIGELAPNQWHFLFPEQLATARFVAGEAAPNRDTIFIRAFDRNDGQGAEGFGLWSLPVSFEAFTTPNINRPVGIETETSIAVNQIVPITELFGFTDAENNTLKSVRFFDTSVHDFSGSIVFNGQDVPAGQFVEFTAAELPNVQFRTASQTLNEQIRFQVFDGNHFSDIATFRVRTNEVPVLATQNDFTIRQQLVDIDISDLFQRQDSGENNIVRYQIFDANTDTESGDFRLGTETFAAGQVHDLTTEQFFDLTFETGGFITRSLDDIYVRAFDGVSYGDWTRHTVRTEPEYLDSLAAGSWLNFRPTVGDTLPLTFSFIQTYPTYGGSIEEEFIPAWAELREGVRNAFDNIENLVNIEFEEVADTVNTQFGLGGDIRIGTYCDNSPGAPAAFAFFPGDNGGLEGDIWLNRFFLGNSAEFFTLAQDPPCGHPDLDAMPPVIPPGFTTPSDVWQPGDSNFFVFGHELGHALGLRHPFSAPPGEPELPAATNHNDFSILAGSGANMSGGVATSPFDPFGFQLYDIAALQAIYGPNLQHALGDDVYNSDSFNGTLNVSTSIYDAGGNDTLDTSDQFIGSSIDLRPGGFSQVGAGGLISIDLSTDIENAIGSQAADTIIGNELDNQLIGLTGNDTLEGYGGDDFLSGGAGNDTFIYKNFDGNDVIDEQLGAGRDTIELGLFLGLDDFATGVSLTREEFDLTIDFDVDGINRGSIRIENQGFGRNRIETLDFFGTPVDLRFAFDQVSVPGQRFSIDLSNQQQFGFGVTPV